MSSTVATFPPDVRTVLEDAVGVVQQLAEYELDPAVTERMHELGERKEYLDTNEHNELVRLVEFWEKRTLEKLRAMNALKRVGEVIPELLDEPCQK